MSRRNENIITELLGVILGSPECKLEGWVAIARPVNIDIHDDVASLLLQRPGVKCVSVFNLGPNLDKVDFVACATLASGYAFGRIDTLIGLNVLGTVDVKKRQSAISKMSQLLTPKGVAYFTRPISGTIHCKKARVQYFTDDEFRKELGGFFLNPTAIPSSNPKYPIMKCGGMPPL